jgi:hypothetical protein
MGAFDAEEFICVDPGGRDPDSTGFLHAGNGG